MEIGICFFRNLKMGLFKSQAKMEIKNWFNGNNYKFKKNLG